MIFLSHNYVDTDGQTRFSGEPVVSIPGDWKVQSRKRYFISSPPCALISPNMPGPKPITADDPSFPPEKKFDLPEAQPITTTAKMSRPLWNEKQVENLMERQVQPHLHPYTCPECSDQLLLPAGDGWRCCYCDYRQAWAHETDVLGEWPAKPELVS